MNEYLKEFMTPDIRAQAGALIGLVWMLALFYQRALTYRRIRSRQTFRTFRERSVFLRPLWRLFRIPNA